MIKSFQSSKKFIHIPLPQFDIERIDSPEGRKYRVPNGNLYESVTSFLGRVTDDGSLDEWRNAVGIEAANKVGLRATTRGTTLHQYCETYLQNKTVEIDYNRMVDLYCFKSLVPILDRVEEILIQETFLFSHTLKLAGAVDLVAKIDNKLYVLDFKSSGKPKLATDIDNYWLQVTIYSMMIEEMYDISIPDIGIIIATEFSPPAFYTDKRRNWIPKLAELLKKDRS